ncbi:DNA polymerase-3 subunit gamma/tau [Cerasibacillus quisquiliarum]|uniref:DNA-directed DNA polymerase n=1 Tax=Cerasibacillus quisquiliarum TaxID=227865 RepID=A0A511UXB3_9BACI|nr:DNA polymerase III subunit gamma/tau [Cerasibacillus quisquiliarum]MBB5146550.1 DNA polymerase-3 subunit gamma/tau [Cerasibacillus quisquiliarum]GEN31249.1 DNA polymerase III subunit gamma/tau [Cerasibacillus quisquiliarum]
MSYQALYRKWRPRKFADVVGQSHITKTLQNAILNNQFSHAYLFSGPRGTGKTSAAKIFAQAINCERAPSEEPCNECQACRGILDGSISDVIEMDAASNTSVEDVRDIREHVKYASTTVPYKVYIIDEVHMISTSAFNALLKTLEEPPKHVVFILATTEPHKIPLTIISRCQRFDFKPISSRAIVQRMRHIVNEEEISASDEALHAIALAAEGGMRDALSMLDQAISYSDGEVSLEDVLAVTGGVSQDILTNIVTAMYNEDIQPSLARFDELIQNGKDPARFVYDMIYFLRDLLLYKSTSTLETLLERATVDEAFKTLAEDISVEWIQDAIMRMNECQQEIKWTNNPKVFIEIALISITNRNQSQEKEQDISNSSVIQKINQLEKEVASLKQATTAPHTEKEVAIQQPKRRQSRPSKNSYKVPFERIRLTLQEAQKDMLRKVQATWATFLAQLKATSAPAHATIQDSKPVAASSKAVVVAFKYEIHCSLFLDNQSLAESILASVSQKNMTIIPIPVTEWKSLRQEYVKNQEQAVTGKETETEPLVEEAKKLFGEEVVKVHD